MLNIKKEMYLIRISYDIYINFSFERIWKTLHSSIYTNNKIGIKKENYNVIVYLYLAMWETLIDSLLSKKELNNKNRVQIRKIPFHRISSTTFEIFYNAPSQRRRRMKFWKATLFPETRNFLGAN